MSANWTNYVDAAHRKIDIAAFHCEQLKTVLGQGCSTFTDRPNIPTQAFFEGTVVATVSAIDQVAQAVNSALNLGLAPGNLFAGASPEIESRVPAFKDWKIQPIGIDLRRLRTRMVHYSYIKSSNGDLEWQVETGSPNYTGARDLSAYAEAAVAYGRELGIIADNLMKSLNACDKANCILLGTGHNAPFF